jgi:hypothetical protein
MRRFRVVAIVDSKDLGEALADLQERGCEVLGCNVVVDDSELLPTEEKTVVEVTEGITLPLRGRPPGRPPGSKKRPSLFKTIRPDPSPIQPDPFPIRPDPSPIRPDVPDSSPISATKWLAEHIQTSPQTDFSRKELMSLGPLGGYDSGAMNTAVQSLFVAGTLQRIGYGMYRKAERND